MPCSLIFSKAQKKILAVKYVKSLARLGFVEMGRYPPKIYGILQCTASQPRNLYNFLRLSSRRNRHVSACSLRMRYEGDLTACAYFSNLLSVLPGLRCVNCANKRQGGQPPNTKVCTSLSFGFTVYGSIH